MKKVEAEIPVQKSSMVRGKYSNLLKQGTNIAILDLDVVDHFPDSESVNDALRAFLAIREGFATVTSSERRPPRKIAAESKYNFDPRTGTRPRKALVAK